MGFFGALGKIINGKPVFDESSGNAEATSTPVSTLPGNANPVHGTARIIPTISIIGVRSSEHGSRLRTTARIINTSDVEIELDKIYIANQRLELDRRLRPRENREITIYDGTVFRSDSMSHRAKLQFKVVQNGDYFETEYRIELHKATEGVFVIEELHPEFGTQKI